MPEGIEHLNRLADRVAAQQYDARASVEAFTRAEALKARRQVETAEATMRSADAAGETVDALQKLLLAQEAAGELEAARHAQMLRWTRASALAATAAAILAVVAIVVTVVLAVA